MTIQIRDAGGVLRTVTAVHLRTVDGVDPANLKAIDQIHLRIANGIVPGDLKQVYQQGIRLAVAPGYATGSSMSHAGPIYTNSVTVSVAGGTPPYSHIWSADGGISPGGGGASASCFFVGAPDSPSGSLEGTATDDVTDANGLTNSISIPISLYRG